MEGLLLCGLEGCSHQQQLSGEFLGGFRACEETPKVEETVICSKTDVDAIWQVLVCLTQHETEEDREQGGCQDARWGSCPTVTGFVPPDLAGLHGAGRGW